MLKRWFSWLQRREDADDGLDFVQDADHYMVYQEPLRARSLLMLAGVALLLFVVWAYFTQVEEIARGEARVVPSRQLQVMQSLDGGIVSNIMVREGQAVEAGQPLLQIDTTRYESSVRENRAEFIPLLVKAARLRALAEGRPFIVPPEAVAADMAVVEQERRYYDSARYEMEAQISIARQQLAQRRQEQSEAQARRDQAAQGYELALHELNVTKPLIGVGAVSAVDLLRLERDVSRYAGERDQAAAQIQGSQASIVEAQRKIDEVGANARNQYRRELTETVTRLNPLQENRVGLQDKVKQSTIRAPLKGVVKRLLVNTEGGVVQPGKDIVELVPSEDTLLLEAKITPRDIAFLRPGQRATVKFTAYDYAIYGGMDALLETIGADSLTDDKGNTFFIVKVRTRKARLADKLPIIPGMVAEVDIITGKKSVLTYLLKPVLRARQIALTER